MQAIILAGGLGTRLRSVVHSIPKPLAPINGQPFLGILMKHFIDQGVTSITLSVGYKSEQIIDHFGCNYLGIPLKYAIEKKQLGTGGGLLNALNTVSKDGKIIFANGDTYFGIKIKNLVDFASIKNSPCTLALAKVDKNNRYTSIGINDSGRIIDICSENCTNIINAGLYILNTRKITDYFSKKNYKPGEQNISFENEVLKELAQDSEGLYGKVYNEEFIDIGVPEDYSIAKRILSNKI